MSDSSSLETEKTLEDPIDGTNLSNDISNSDLAKNLESANKIQTDSSESDDFPDVSDLPNKELEESNDNDSLSEAQKFLLCEESIGLDDSLEAWKTTYEILEESLSTDDFVKVPESPLDEEQSDTDSSFRTCMTSPQPQLEARNSSNQSKKRSRTESDSRSNSNDEAQNEPDENVDNKEVDSDDSSGTLQEPPTANDVPPPNSTDQPQNEPDENADDQDTGSSSKTWSLISTPDNPFRTPDTNKDKRLLAIPRTVMQSHEPKFVRRFERRSLSPPDFGVSIVPGLGQTKKKFFRAHSFTTSTPKAKKIIETAFDPYHFPDDDSLETRNPKLPNVEETDEFSDTIPSGFDDSKNEESDFDETSERRLFPERHPGDMKKN